MEDLAEQIVEHFPTEDKVFSKNKEIFKRRTFLKDLFSNSRRNLGIFVMVAIHAVVFIFVFTTHVETWVRKATARLQLQKLSLTLLQAKMNMRKRYL